VTRSGSGRRQILPADLDRTCRCCRSCLRDTSHPSPTVASPSLPGPLPFHSSRFLFCWSPPLSGSPGPHPFPYRPSLTPTTPPVPSMVYRSSLLSPCYQDRGCWSWVLGRGWLGYWEGDEARGVGTCGSGGDPRGQGANLGGLRWDLGAARRSV